MKPRTAALRTTWKPRNFSAGGITKGSNVRETGFYWTRLNNFNVPGNWHVSLWAEGRWYLIGTDWYTTEDAALLEIREERILPPLAPWDELAATAAT
jgi:hypothetical protein